MNKVTRVFNHLKSRVIRAHNDYIANTSIVQALKEDLHKYIDRLSESDDTICRQTKHLSNIVRILYQRNILTSENDELSRNVKYTISGQVDKVTCASIQLADGHHPAGYGFSSYKYDDTTDTTTWTRWNNCD